MFKGRMIMLAGIGGMLLLGWLTEDILRLGLFDWFRGTFGFEWGFLLWWFFWLLLIYGVIQLIRKAITSNNTPSFRNTPSPEVAYHPFLTLLGEKPTTDKKSSFQEIADRLDTFVEMRVTEDAQRYANVLRDLITGIAESANMIDSQRAMKLSEEGVIHFSNMLRGAYLIGYDFGQKKHIDLYTHNEQNDIPTEAKKPIREITQPLEKVVNQLVEINHVQGRIILLKEDKEKVKLAAFQGIYVVTTKYFFEGLKQSLGSTAK